MEKSTKSPETWDGASLFSSVGEAACERESRHGFATLNEAERVLCCLFLLDNEVNNGGFGQWLLHCRPDVLAHTSWACARVGAVGMERLVKNVLSQVADWMPYEPGELPREVSANLERCSVPFLRMERELLTGVYSFARAHWREVRGGPHT